MKNSFWNRGEIATVLTLVGVGILVVGIAAGKQIIEIGSHLLSQAATTTKTLTFKATEDSYVNKEESSKNYGDSRQLIVNGGNNRQRDTYVKFSVIGISGTVKKAKVRLYVTDDATENGPAVYKTSNTWSENKLTWSNKPAKSGDKLADTALLPKNAWAEFDVIKAVTSNGVISFVLIPTSSNGVTFSSSEGSNPPQLLITYEVTAPTRTPTKTPTKTPTPKLTKTPTPKMTRTPTPDVSRTPTPINTCEGEGTACSWCPGCYYGTPACLLPCLEGICTGGTCQVVNVSNTPFPTPCTLDENPCNPTSCSYDPDICNQLTPTEAVPTPTPTPVPSVTLEPTFTPTPPAASLTPIADCACNVDNTCNSSCVFQRMVGIHINYASPMKCRPELATGSSQLLTIWCQRQMRASGDADGIGNVNLVDFDYYRRAVLLDTSIPNFVNADFNGDGEVGTMDATIILSALGLIPIAVP